jgi:hypothetical protein
VSHHRHLYCDYQQLNVCVVQLSLTETSHHLLCNLPEPVNVLVQARLADVDLSP